MYTHRFSIAFIVLSASNFAGDLGLLPAISWSSVVVSSSESLLFSWDTVLAKNLQIFRKSQSQLL